MFDTYQSIFEKRADVYHAAMRTWPQARRSEFMGVLAPLGPLSGKLVCDMPAGGGYLAHFLPADARYLAVEPTSLFYGSCTENERCDRVMAPIDAVPRPDGSVDHVVSLAGLHHVPDLMPVLREMRRLVAAKGSVVLCDVAAGSTTDRFLNSYVHKTNSMGHEGVFLDDSLAQRLADARLVLVDDTQVAMPWHFETRHDAGEYCRMLFGIDRAVADDVATALESIVGAGPADDGYTVAWTLRRVVCSPA